MRHKIVLEETVTRSEKARIKKAVATLEELLMECFKDDKPDEVSVYIFMCKGIRVAEVSCVKKTKSGIAGWSAMRCDGSRLLFACEEFLITYGRKAYRPPGWESDIDIHGEAVDMVKRFASR